MFDNFGYMLEYVELRMPGPFSPRFLKYPVHLMILGKVLEQSEKQENAETGRRMIAGAAERDPALERFREAPLAELMEYHATFLAEHPEMLREWNNAENFHGLMVHFILPVVIIVGIVSFILKGCTPPELVEDQKKETEASAAVKTQTKKDQSATVEMQKKTEAPAAAEPQKEAGTASGEAGETVTAPQATVPPQA